MSAPAEKTPPDPTKTQHLISFEIHASFTASDSSAISALLNAFLLSGRFRVNWTTPTLGCSSITKFNLLIPFILSAQQRFLAIRYPNPYVATGPMPPWS